MAPSYNNLGPPWKMQVISYPKLNCSIDFKTLISLWRKLAKEQNLPIAGIASVCILSHLCNQVANVGNFVSLVWSLVWIALHFHLLAAEN